MWLPGGPAHKFIQHRTLDILMFGWVDAFRMNFPTISVDRSLQMFADRYNLPAEDYNLETARQTYYRMAEQQVQYLKEKRI